ncbi:amino acid adenylation domain-containing protein [Solwaraspora sp. WMMD791]|uniref:amino acid adenylation domain-containing protein n=1 Tax=Solwaraspora sp. WMMD791 TaxID=3016086 RepID=UPI00249B412B|nr:amino acid adenylation domain-containing protein [Solwaraspora sp. WMMD791]WFE26114.1 amino acid adenylation domain-containing protein [Solwaraspora sp. WMMD791]
MSAEPVGAPVNLVDVFARTVAAYPQRTALVAGGESLSYSELDAWAETARRALHARGVRRDDRVALRMPPSAEAIVAILGILRAGAAYVPLDVRNPAARNRLIVEDSEVAALVGDPDACPVDGRPVLTGAELRRLRDEPLARLRHSSPAPGETAYVIYTSGTTGTPKGVRIQHSAVTALLAAAGQRFAFTADDRWLLFHSLAFDVSVWEMWGAFTTGARLVVLPYWSTRSPEKCLDTVIDEGVSVLNVTPTAFNGLAGAALRAQADLPALRYVVFAGEKLTPAVLRPWAKRFGLSRPMLVNMYGITEVTVHATFHQVTEDDLDGDVSVVGRPLPGFTHRIRTPDGQDADIGEEGVLWLAGPQLSAGYLNRPDLNAERFALLPSPDGGPPQRYYRSGDLVRVRADGNLVYRGREDLQVKLRGHRIELSDVEAAVADHPAVLSAVVWVRRFGPEDERLVCAYVPTEAGSRVEVPALREHVRRVLPQYMRPAAYQELPALPRTINGKVDRDTVARAWERQKGER